MKRLLLIAAAVLVPFAALVALGLWALREEPAPLPMPSPEPPAAVVAAEPLHRPAPEAAPAPPPPAPAAAEADPLPAPDERRAPARKREPAEPKAALIAQLTPVVNTCFLDTSSPLKQAIRITATFDPLPNGTLTNVRVKMRSADPYLSACVQDVLEGAQLDLAQDGLPQGTVRHTFVFDPNPRK